MTHTSTEQPSLEAIIHDLRASHAQATAGTWGKGTTTHETVSRTKGQPPYKVADFRHANDAQFCDLAHAFAPRLIAEVESLQKRVQELEASRRAQVVQKFSPVAQTKLGYLLEAGEVITGYAIENKDGRRGAIDCHGFVYWWNDAAPVQMPEPEATVHSKIGTTCMFPSSKMRKGDKIYTEHQVRQILAQHGIK